MHFRAQLIGVARSAVAAAAYRHRTSMFDQALDRIWSYKPDPALVFSALAMPAGAPQWLTSLVSGRSIAEASANVWNAASAAEKRYDGQVAREFVIALPIELTRAQNIALMQNYVSEFTERGFVVDWVVHDKPGNPHVHLMHTMRSGSTC